MIEGEPGEGARRRRRSNMFSTSTPQYLLYWKHYDSANIYRAPSTTVVLRWLSGAGTSQEVWSLI